MPEIAAEPCFQVSPCICLVRGIAVYRTTYCTAVERADKENCNNCKKEPERSSLCEISRAHTKKEQRKIDYVHDNHADKIVPAVKKSFFYEETFHMINLAE